MTIRHLDKLLKPKCLALIGASRRDRSVGQVVARNLFNGGFDGPIMPVHPDRESVEGVLAYRSVADLPVTPDLAVICTPPDSVAPLVAELGARGTKAAVVITAGFGEGGSDVGADRRQAMLDAARPHLLRVVGPNCVGLMVPRLGLNASFSHIGARRGDLAFVTQSGALVTTMLDWATPRGIGFSHVISVGDMADVDFGDTLDYLALDGGTRSILLYVEAITDARKFMSAARAAARNKPVIVIKGGRFEASAKAVASHTGALAGSDAVYDAAFRRAGALRVHSMSELFDAAETLATVDSDLPSGSSDRLAILTNGGGPGVLASDALLDDGGRLAELATETMARLEEALPATWSQGNPVDIIGDAPGSRYTAALEALLDDPQSDAVLVLNCPTAVADPGEAAQAVVEVLDQRSRRYRRPVLTAWLGDPAAAESRRLFAARRIPSYATPAQAVRAFLHMVRHRRSRELLMETPPSIANAAEPDTAAARGLLRAVQAEGRAWLTEPEAKAVLAAYRIPVVETRTAGDVEAAVGCADAIGYPVALKILSPDITHKSDVGGVALDIEDADALRGAAQGMLRRAQESRPDVRIDGFSVQAMCRYPGARELILGMIEDAQFGPVLLFGEGGTAVEVIADRAVALPPLNLRLARALMAETRIFHLLQGYRDEPPADLAAIEMALVRLSQMAADLAEIVEVDINPLLAGPQGVMALDARIRVAPPGAVDPAQPPAARLAIRPYPKELEQLVTLRDGTEVPVRPVRPEDEPALREAFGRMTVEDLRMRFFAPIGQVSHEMAARMTQIDYDREMMLLAVDPGAEGEILAGARIVADPDRREAEFAVTVRSDQKGRGLGSMILGRVLDYAADCGIGEVWGDVLAENRAMLAMAEHLGFTRRALPEDPTIVQVRKKMG